MVSPEPEYQTNIYKSKYKTNFMKDFGIVDILYSKLSSSKKDNLIGDPNFKRTIHNDNGDSKEPWVCFLPWRIRTEEAAKLGLIPKKHKAIVYEGPIGIANPNPQIARDLQQEIVKDIHNLNLGTFNVLTYSVGTYPGFYVANHFPTSKLVSVVPGARLGACIWDGIATQKVRELAIQNYDIQDARQYDTILKGTNPIENIANLPENIEVHLASHDKYIRTPHGEELVKEMINQGKNPQVKRYSGKGHVLSLDHFGKHNKL